MFNQIVDAIHETAIPKYKYVIGNHFTEQSQLSLEDFTTFLCFREGRTLQSDIESFYEKCEKKQRFKKKLKMNIYNG